MYALLSFGAQCLVGGLIGGTLGYAGALKAHYEYPVPDLASFIQEHTLAGALVGLIAAVLHQRYRSPRKRGKTGHYLAWASAVGGAVAIVALPETLANQRWLDYFAIVFVGIVSGLGFGFYARRAAGHES